MKVVFITIIILILFFVGTFYINQHVISNAEIMLVHVNSLDRSVEQFRWQEAKVHMKNFEESWKGTKKLWLLFMEHSEIDNVDTLAAKINKFIQIEEREMALGEIVVLNEVLDHIIKKQYLKLSNIM